MPTCTCGNRGFAIVDNYQTCLNCGLCHEYMPKYVMSYSTPHVFQRKCYYSRIKRFQKKLREMHLQIIGENSEDILNMYGRLEFGWNMLPNKKRKYFFSQKVVLFFILTVLEIDSIAAIVPLLKNKDRTEQQLRAMGEIMDNAEIIDRNEEAFSASDFDITL